MPSGRVSANLYPRSSCSLIGIDFNLSIAVDAKERRMKAIDYLERSTLLVAGGRLFAKYPRDAAEQRRR
jgi:hypothetical protein